MTNNLPIIHKAEVEERKSHYDIRSVWKMYFDGSSSREEFGVGIVLISLSNEAITLSYKMEFQTTNNIVEYEALILGLMVAKDLKIQAINVLGDFELVIEQIKNVYQPKHPRLKQYRNEVWDLTEFFFLAFNISFISKNSNELANSLAIATNNFNSPLNSNLVHEIQKNIDLQFLII